EGSRADRSDARRSVRGPPQPVQDGRVLQQRSRAESTRYDQDVDRRSVREIEMRHDAQPADRDDGTRPGRHREDVERSGVVAASRCDARCGPCSREHLERPCEIETLDVVEDENPDLVACRHGFLLPRTLYPATPFAELEPRAMSRPPFDPRPQT